MRKRNYYWRIAAAVLALSLLLAENYVEYGKGVRASETEGGGKILNQEEELCGTLEISERKTDLKEEKERESEGETERESESESELESQIESATEIQWKTEQEIDPDIFPEPEPEEVTESEEPFETEISSEPGETQEPEEAGTEGEMEPETMEEPEEVTESEEPFETEISSEPGETQEPEEAGTEGEMEPETAEESEEVTEPGEPFETEISSEPGETQEPEEAGTEGEMEPETAEESEEITEPGEPFETEISSEPGETQESEEVGTEGETEAIPLAVTVKNIQAKLPEGGRIYDGTDEISLTYEAEGLRKEDRDLLKYEAYLEGSNAGKQTVKYRFWLSEKEKEYQLWVEEAKITVEVLPKQLTVTVPDGWKVYGYPASMEHVHLLGSVQVEGFIKNEKGEEQIPQGFQMPKVGLDTGKISQWSQIYEQGVQKNYDGVLVLQRDKQGEILGDPTENYVFPGKGKYKKGNLKIVQNQAVLGQDYEIRGQYGYSADGTLWVRRGTSLAAAVLEGSGYSEGTVSKELWQDGVFSFSLKRRSANGEILADSQQVQIAYRVDEQVPAGEIRIQGAGEAGESYYSNQPVIVEIRIPEDGKSGIKSAEYFIFAGREAVLSGALQTGWQDCRKGSALQLSREGAYTIYVRTEDHTGNRGMAKSGTIVVDTTVPQLLFQGIRPNSANSQEAALTVSCHDDHYEKGSLTVQFSGANGGKTPSVLKKEDGERGGVLQFADFPHEKAFDDVYTVVVAARDQAGNESLETFTFSVNRFGSVYDLETETGEKLQEVYHSEAFPVVFLENNIDFVGEVQILCSRNGELLELQQGKDYIRERQGGKESWKQYRYEISPEVFEEEGTYEVLLLSKDRAKNSQDTQTQQKSVRFVIDRSAPECLIVGVEDQKVYRAEELWIILEPRDNGKLKKMEIYRNGEKQETFTGEKLKELEGLVKWKAEGGKDWQKLKVYLEDQAGNSYWTEEISFLVTGEGKGVFQSAGTDDQKQETANFWRTTAFFSVDPDVSEERDGFLFGEKGGKFGFFCVCGGFGIFLFCRWIMWRYRKKTWTFEGSYDRINHKERKR